MLCASAGFGAAFQPHGGELMTRAKKTEAEKSFRLELTKEQQALVLEKIGLEAKEVELTVDQLERRTDPKQVGNQP
jgi:hypothetical protein